jgi:hypothetical protein
MATTPALLDVALPKRHVRNGCDAALVGGIFQQSGDDAHACEVLGKRERRLHRMFGVPVFAEVKADLPHDSNERVRAAAFTPSRIAD